MNAAFAIIKAIAWMVIVGVVAAAALYGLGMIST